MLWLRAVAMPAPAVPRPKPNIKMGSSTMFSTPPVTRLIMASSPCLIAQDVVHHKAGDHKRGCNEDGPCISAGVGRMVSVLPSSIMKLGRVARPTTASTTPTARAVKKLVEAKRVAASVFRLPSCG